jgi:hypothetical protein
LLRSPPVPLPSAQLTCRTFESEILKPAKGSPDASTVVSSSNARHLKSSDIRSVSSSANVSSSTSKAANSAPVVQLDFRFKPTATENVSQVHQEPSAQQLHPAKWLDLLALRMHNHAIAISPQQSINRTSLSATVTLQSKKLENATIPMSSRLTLSKPRRRRHRSRSDRDLPASRLHNWTGVKLNELERLRKEGALDFLYSETLSQLLFLVSPSVWSDEEDSSCRAIAPTSVKSANLDLNGSTLSKPPTVTAIDNEQLFQSLNLPESLTRTQQPVSNVQFSSNRSDSVSPPPLSHDHLVPMSNQRSLDEAWY